MRAIYRKIRHARYLYIKRNVEKVWGARYTLGARYLSKNTIDRYIYIYIRRSSCKVSIFLSDYNKTSIISKIGSKVSVPVFTKLCPVGAEILDTDAQDDADICISQLLCTRA